jgi:putative glycosyltransferase
MNTPAPLELSIVSTLYKSRPFLEEFLHACLEAVARLPIRSYELVLVNDGSPDESLAYVLSRRKDIPQLVVVDLTRNFGHHAAMLAGIRTARGERIFVIDCDLEVHPSVLPQFFETQQRTGADLVYGYQEVRKGGWFERVSGGLFWKGFNLLSDLKVPENMLTERIMTRRYAEALCRLGDHNLFLGGMMTWVGFDQIGIPIPKGQRAGQSTYTLLKRVRLMINAVTSFTAQPLVWMFNAGVVITLASFTFLAYLVVRRLVFGDVLLGFTSLMGMMALSLGILTTALGLIGIYLGKVFSQVQNRPNYIIRDIHRSWDDA